MDNLTARKLQSMLGLYEKRAVSLTACVLFFDAEGYDIITLTENFHGEDRKMGTLTARCLPKGLAAPYSVVSVTMSRV